MRHCLIWRLQDTRVWVEQPGTAIVADDEGFASARQRWHRSGAR
jgi:hypothetical protein